MAQLLADLPEAAGVTEAMLDKARVLDGYYIPARYPNGHPSGAPFEHYGKLQSGEAIHYAREILDFARSQMA